MTGTYTIQDFGPYDLLTISRYKYRRIRVDLAQTGFFEGRVRNSGPPCAGFLLLAICKSGTIFASS